MVVVALLLLLLLQAPLLPPLLRWLLLLLLLAFRSGQVSTLPLVSCKPMLPVSVGWMELISQVTATHLRDGKL